MYAGLILSQVGCSGSNSWSKNSHHMQPVATLLAYKSENC